MTRNYILLIGVLALLIGLRHASGAIPFIIAVATDLVRQYRTQTEDT